MKLDNIMRKIGIIFLLFNLFVATISSATVDTVSIHSEKMGIESKAVVIKPLSYESGGEFPVLYLLHGYGGRYDGWINRVPSIQELSDQYGMMIVCPDGSIGSWYLDSPVDSTSQYETFVSKELTAWIDSHYKTVASREGRAITGLSMGGHGGLYLAFRNQEQFGAFGSMSGGVDIRPFPNRWEISKRIGIQHDFPERWEEYSVMGILHLLTPDALKIIIDCGTEDFFFQVNERLHNELLYRNIPHDYITRPGAHNWDYWSNSIKYQALFFSDYFRSHRQK